MKNYVIRATANLGHYHDKNGILIGYLGNDDQSGGGAYATDSKVPFLRSVEADSEMDYLSRCTELLRYSGGSLATPYPLSIFIHDYRIKVGCSQSSKMKIKVELIQIDLTDVLAPTAKLLRFIDFEVEEQHPGTISETKPHCTVVNDMKQKYD